MSDVVSAGARSRARCPVTRSRATRCLDGEKERPSGPHMRELAVRLPGEGEARTVSKMHRRRYRSATRIPSAAPPYRPKAVLREKSPSQSDMSYSHHPSPPQSSRSCESGHSPGAWEQKQAADRLSGLTRDRPRGHRSAFAVYRHGHHDELIVQRRVLVACHLQDCTSVLQFHPLTRSRRHSCPLPFLVDPG